MAKFSSKLLYLFLGFSFIVLAGAGATVYEGSPYIYAFFSLVFFALLIDGVYRGSTLGYKFLVIFLWLGFWMKLVAHLLLNYAYLEPIGHFHGMNRSWDSVLIVSSTGALGVMLAKILFSRLFTKSDTQFVNKAKVPYWYPRLRLWLWSIVFFLIVTVTVHYFFTLLPNVSSLPWPLQGLTVWFLGFGLIALVASLVHWDEIANFHCKIGVAAILVEGFLSSMSLLSRAIYLFHTLPFLIVFFSRKLSTYSIKIKKITVILIGWLALLVISITSVIVLRYSDASPLDVSSDKSLKLSSVQSFSHDITRRVSLLLVDRWIGLEGVMAVTAYPEKSIESFIENAFADRQHGDMDSFTKESLTGGLLSDQNAQKYNFSTSSGSIALFYSSGSLWVVFVGMVGLVILMLTLEQLAFFLTANNYLCAVFSMSIAQSITSLSVGIKPTFVYYATSFFSLLLLYVLQVLSSYWQRKV